MHRTLLPSAKKFITSTAEKIANLESEEKATIQLRKKLHKAINDRTQEVFAFILVYIDYQLNQIYSNIRTTNSTNLVIRSSKLL